jgi:hypothetical protein
MIVIQPEYNDESPEDMAWAGGYGRAVGGELVIRQAQDKGIRADHGKLVEPQTQGDRLEMPIQL